MKQFKVVFIFLVIGLLGSLVGYGIGSIDSLKRFLPNAEDVSLWMLVFVFIGAYLAIFIHELGHLLTGMFYGFKFQLFVVGFFGVRRNEDGEVKAYFNKDFNSFGGLAATSPSKYDRDTINQFANMIMAGPAISVLWALVCLGLTALVDYPLKLLFFTSGLTSFFVFLGVMIPSKSGVMYTDRKRYQRLKSKGIERDIEHVFMQAFTKKMTGQGLSSIPYEELEIITKDPSPLFQYIGYLYLIEHSKADEKKRESLVQSMMALNDQLPKAMVKAFAKELERISV